MVEELEATAPNGEIMDHIGMVKSKFVDIIIDEIFRYWFNKWRLLQ